MSALRQLVRSEPRRALNETCGHWPDEPRAPAGDVYVCSFTVGGPAMLQGRFARGSGTCDDPFIADPGGGEYRGVMVGQSRQQGTCGSSGGVEQVYAWTPTRSGGVNVVMRTNYWPGSIYVRQAGCSGTELACQANVNQWPSFNLQWSAGAGTTYYVLVDSFYNGPMTLSSVLSMNPP